MKKFLRFLNSHKTKITGGLLIAMGSLQANAAMVQTVLNPHQFALFTICAGALVALLGFLNSAPKSSP